MWGHLGALAYSIIPSIIQRDAMREANYENRKQAEELNANNIAMQREFAKNSIRWKIEDARAAGLHPLAAIGATGSSFTPVGAFSENQPASLAPGLAEVGQNISRAIASTSTSEEKQYQKLQLAHAKLNLEGQAIENQMKLSQLHQLNSAGPALPGSSNFMPGQGDSGMKINPSSRISSDPSRPAQQLGWVPDVGYARTDTGLTPVPSSDVKERIEDQMVPEAMWAMRNYIMPNVGIGKTPPKSMLPSGYHGWDWSHAKQEWQPVKIDYDRYQTKARLK